MQYFVGTWTCAAGPAADPTRYKTKVTFAIDSEIMHERDIVQVPGQTALYSISKSIAYDARNDRWVQTQVDDQDHWRVSYLMPWTGNKEEWFDHSSFDGTLGRVETVRSDANDFAFSSCARSRDATAQMVGRCTRST